MDTLDRAIGGYNFAYTEDFEIDLPNFGVITYDGLQKH